MSLHEALQGRTTRRSPRAWQHNLHDSVFYPRGKKTAPHNRVFTRRWPPVGSPGSWVLPNRPDQDGSDNDAVSKRVWRMWAGEGSRPEKNRDGMEFDGYRRCVPRCARKAVGACGEKRSCKQKKPTLTPIRKRWEETSTRLSCMQDVSPENTTTRNRGLRPQVNKATYCSFGRYCCLSLLCSCWSPGQAAN